MISQFRHQSPLVVYLNKTCELLSDLQQGKQTGEHHEKNQKGRQLKLTNPKNTGRPAIRDKGIRYTRREEIIASCNLHLTIKMILDELVI